MTAEQFVLWLDGLLTGNHGAQPSEKQWEAIVSRMEEVMKPRNEMVSPKVMMRTKPMDREEIGRMIGDARAGNLEVPVGPKLWIDPRTRTPFYGPVVIPGVSQ